jgi:hypothetical protein
MLSAVAGALLLAACADDQQGPTGVAQYVATTGSFSGRATSVTVTGIVNVLQSDAQIFAPGGDANASLLNLTVPNLLTARLLWSRTLGKQADFAESRSSVTDLFLTLPGLTITANVLESEATAKCGRIPPLKGYSNILDLTINGQPYTVTSAPNQQVVVNGITVIINEQTTSNGGITVNALHVTANGIADVIVSHAHANAGC